VEAHYSRQVAAAVREQLAVLVVHRLAVLVHLEHLVTLATRLLTPHQVAAVVLEQAQQVQAVAASFT
jgi:hypothetical protein